MFKATISVIPIDFCGGCFPVSLGNFENMCVDLNEYGFFYFVGMVIHLRNLKNMSTVTLLTQIYDMWYIKNK